MSYFKIIICINLDCFFLKKITFLINNEGDLLASTVSENVKLTLFLTYSFIFFNTLS